MSERTTVYDRGEDQTLRFDQIVGWLKGLDSPHHAVALAREVASRTEALGSLSFKTPDNTLTAWDLGLAILAAFDAYPVYPGLVDLELDLGEVADDLLRRVRNLVPRMYYEVPDESEQRRQHRAAYLTEVWSRQSALQLDPIHEIARARIMLGLAGFGDLPADPTAADALTTAAYGFDTDAVFAVLAALWMRAGDGELALRTLTQSSKDTDRHRELCLRVVEHHSVKAADVRTELQELASRDRVEGLASQFFGRFPCVEIDQQEYILAPPPYFLDAISMGFVRAMSRVALDHYGTQTNPFREWLGERFESYVGQLLYEACPADTVHEDFPFDLENNRSTDWIVFQGGDDVLLMECKVREIPGAVVYGSEPEQIDTLVDTRGSSHAVFQIAKMLCRMVQAAGALQLAPEHAARARQILATKRWHFAIVSPDLPAPHHLLGGPGRLAEAAGELLKEKHAEFAKRWERWCRNGRVASITPMASRDLEFCVGRGLGPRLCEALGEYSEYLSSMDGPVSESGAIDGFYNFVCRHFGTGRGVVESLRDVQEDAMGVVSEEWFGAGARARLNRRLSRQRANARSA